MHAKGLEYIEEKEVRVCKKWGIREFPVRLCFLTISEDTPMNSHQQDYANGVIPVDMPKRT